MEAYVCGASRIAGSSGTNATYMLMRTLLIHIWLTPYAPALQLSWPKWEPALTRYAPIGRCWSGPTPDRPVLLTATGDVSTRLEARDTVAARVCTVTRRHRVVYHYYYYDYPSRVSRSSVVAYVADIIHMQGFTISSTEMETDGG
ncbi:hypothetical protein B296_00056786 [Ensete ventricosum]|uniref:Uncharacterized protein n=1 Tax=Ensete ventricosum TaxID=4639 RepID=A0A426XTV4_ENSVE|nr:hypothetical protein B296_00056786 [Ensete ventricosum]